MRLLRDAGLEFLCPGRKPHHDDAVLVFRDLGTLAFHLGEDAAGGRYLAKGVRSIVDSLEHGSRGMVMPPINEDGISGP